MNAFPPPRYVTGGVYAWLAHPIYVGFCALVAGVAILARSASGLWLISPLVALAATALVLGYERDDLRSRFGDALLKPRVRLAGNEAAAPSAGERISCYLLVLGPWLALYEAIATFGVPPDARSAFLSFEQRLPVIEWSELFYLSAYPLACLAPLVAGTSRDLRRFSVRVLLAMAVVFPMYLALPLIAPPRPFSPHGPLGSLLAWERTLDTPGEAFPSFHVILSILAAEVFVWRMPRLKILWRAWAAAVAASCIATGMHAVIDVAAGFVVAALVMRAEVVWQRLRAATQAVANSWKEWRFGPIRMINHGFYVGLGSFVGLAIAGTFAGRGNAWLIVVCAFSGLLFAGLSAQYIEGSSRLLRPFGYYGGVLGVVFVSLAAPLFSASPWLPLAAFSVAGPWVQSLGRLRCLVQGCCHGRPAAKEIGIRHTHPRSRVCRLTEWRGLPLHPTPLYSILWNAVVALATVRLWAIHAPLSLIAGLYLILGGLGRFVEEGYRGEPQTRILARLRLYQWIAIATVLAGIAITTVPSGPAPAPQFYWGVLIPATCFGLATAFAMGVDFPESNRRFARLT
jgi:membrane-associated phospholipid phosphatase